VTILQTVHGLDGCRNNLRLHMYYARSLEQGLCSLYVLAVKKGNIALLKFFSHSSKD